jgi:hypothetical protein
MTTIENTALASVAAENRLLNAVLKGPTTKPKRFGFRGDIALKFQTALADEKRPPEFCVEQVLVIAEEGAPTIPFFAGYLHNFAHLKDFVDVLGEQLTPGGKYFLYANNIDFLAKYRVQYNGLEFVVLCCDESTVWKEVLELLSIDKNDIKKLDTAGKLDFVMDAAKGFTADYSVISYDDVVAKMEPVKNRNENRPV